MFKVTFASPVALFGKSQTVFLHERLEPCVEVAMLVHRYSNVPHTIEVVLDDETDEKVQLSLVLKENLEGKNKK